MMDAPRSPHDLAEAFAFALDDLATGLPRAEVLSRYPEFTADLAPLIETAQRLETTAWPTLSVAGKVRGREQMQAELHRGRRGGFFGILRPLFSPLATLAVLVALASGVWLARPGGDDGLNAAATSTVTLATAMATPGASTATPPVEAGATRTPWAEAPMIPTTAPVTTSLSTTPRPPATVSGDDITSSPTRTSTPAPSPTLRSETPTTPGPTPQPTATTRPEATPVATVTSQQPSRTPRPSETPEPTETLEPSPTPGVSPTSTPSRTAEPTETRRPDPTETPSPTSTHTPQPTQMPTVTVIHTPKPTTTNTPRPTETPTPKPTETKKPSETPKPTQTEEPTKTPTPTKTPD